MIHGQPACNVRRRFAHSSSLAIPRQNDPQLKKLFDRIDNM